MAPVGCSYYYEETMVYISHEMNKIMKSLLR